MWACVTAWGAIVHGHPAYAVLLGAAALLAVLGVVVALRFQPGALVDPRAYAAVLRPLAAAGHPVVIVKQPLGIAFLALGAFDDARDVVPDADGWVIGGHSLGGTVAAMQADEHDEDTERRATGLILYASYPADDISETLTTQVLSISGTEDGLATPSKIADTAATLPVDTEFLVLDGVSHAQFGSYGPQPGDGVPQVSDASLDFVSSSTAG